MHRATCRLMVLMIFTGVNGNVSLMARPVWETVFQASTGSGFAWNGFATSEAKSRKPGAMTYPTTIPSGLNRGSGAA
jgi:hypothetical protein